MDSLMTPNLVAPIVAPIYWSIQLVWIKWARRESSKVLPLPGEGSQPRWVPHIRMYGNLGPTGRSWG